VSEIILAGSSGKTAVAEAVQQNGGFPPTASAPVATQVSKYVVGVDYISGASTTGAVYAVANGGATGEPKLLNTGVKFTGTLGTAGNGQVVCACQLQVNFTCETRKAPSGAFPVFSAWRRWGSLPCWFPRSGW
jgi:hypothetical protein